MASQRFLLWTTFISGMSLMALEINASRILAPYFGSSLFVWSSIIGIVLLALSLGYYFGGKIADKHPRASILYSMLFAVGVWMTILPWLSTFLLNIVTIQNVSTSLVFVAIAFCFVLFLPPCTLMGMVSPYVLKLYTANIKDLGRESGKLYAISTIGSLIGTFIPALITIPLIGSLRTTLLFAFCILLTAAIGLKKRWMLAFPLITALLFTFAHPTFTNADTIFQTESSYGYINIYDRNNIRFLQLDAPYGVHSIKIPDSLITKNYWDYFTVIPFYKPTNKTLLLGVAGGNISALLHQYFPHMKITGVEIDPAIVDAAKKYFDLEQPNLEIKIDDARSFLHHTPNTYDLIIMDVYHDLNIPNHLSTKEFFSLAKSKLNTHGTVAINVAHSDARSDLDKYVAATLHSVFPYVYIVDTNQGYNSLLLGSDAPWPTNTDIPVSQYPELHHVWSKYPPRQITTFNEQLIQTDDQNSIELIAGQEVFQTIKK